MKNQIYLTHERLYEILKELGVGVQYETATDIAAFCPFHDNRDSPAFNMSLRAPYLWKCWNGKCNQQGNIISLLTKKGYTGGEAKKMLMADVMMPDDFLSLINDLLKEDSDDGNEWDGVDPKIFREEDKAHGYPARQYLEARGVSNAAYDHFRMGYSYKKRMLVVPVFDINSKFSGIVGRSIENKRYQYSTGMDRSGLVWNLNRALGSDLILTEGALDSVAIWDAGLGNVGAIFGSAISDKQWRLIKSIYGNVTCFFDNDDAGKALTNSIINNSHGVGVSIVRYPDRTIELDDGSRPVKDPGELTQIEILEMFNNRKTSIDVMLGA